jgi:uncharacterized repeat protein (TIGR03803 family)
MTEDVQDLRGMGMRRRAASGTLALVILLSLIVTTRPAQAQTFTVLYAFTGTPDGNNPLGGLVGDSAGNLYGTTWGGGRFEMGTVFELDATGKETVLHSFAGADGAGPFEGLMRDAAGNFYGTTVVGGHYDHGTVFKLNATGKYKVLHSFSGADGSDPITVLVRDAAGNLYGTTYRGGVFDHGTVFKLDATGKETVLHCFVGDGSDGVNPHGGLVRDATGNLYGTTFYGGPSYAGTVFELSADGKYKVLHSFTDDGADGIEPSAGLIRDAAGNLYGTTRFGGTFNLGTAFKLSAAGKFKVLHSFGGADGANPYGNLILRAGILYGTTYRGGVFDHGTVFKLDATGKETVLHSFDYYLDGANPNAGLILDAAGNFYGTAYLGGPLGNDIGYGTVFKLTP